MHVPPAFVHRYPPQRARFGCGAAKRLGPLLEELGLTRCLVVTGEHVGASVWIDELLTGAGGRIIDVYRGVRPHAPTETVDVGVEIARAARADGLISIGGGSAHDTMRAIALCLRSGQPMLAHFPADQSFVRDPTAAETGPALIAIPSTLSAAETTFGGGVVHGGRKLVFVGESLYVSDIVLDPEVFATTPVQTLLATGMNALNHATERLLSPRRQPIADAQFLHAMRLLVPGLRQLAQAGTNDREALVSCVIGAHLSGSTNVLGGVGHAIAHVLGARYQVGHGVANGIVLPRALHHAAPGHPETIAMIAGTLGVANDADELERVLVELVAATGLPSRLSEIGVPRSDLPGIVTDTLADFSTAAATPGLTASSVQALLERAY